MSAKFIIAPVVLILLLGAGGVWFTNQKVGNLAPAILPPAALPSSPADLSLEATAKREASAKEGNLLPVTLNSDRVQIFARNIPRARDLVFTDPNTLLVSSLDGSVYAISVDQNGANTGQKAILTNLDRPHGLTFRDGKLYVAEESSLKRYTWNSQTQSVSLDKEILKLPSGGRHFTRTLEFDDQGRLFVSLGSSCDVCFEQNPWIATVIATDQDGANPRVFSKGLRNAVFLAKKPDSNQIWATEMGRDFLGDDLPPDEINILADGGDFGWPVCYGDRVRDTNFDKNNQYPDYCSKTVPPVGQIPAHSAPLGLTFINSAKLPANWQGDLLVALHGSWNSSVPKGYKLIKMDIENGNVVGSQDFLTGFLQGSQANARPVDMVFDNRGDLYVSDDKAGQIFKISF